VITLAKLTPEREWLAGVPSVALVRACNYARRAYRNWFDSLAGRRKGRSANDGPKPLHVRSWQCKACGVVHDRDVNAARNILAAGRAERLNACGGTVRSGVSLARPGEPGTHRGAA